MAIGFKEWALVCEALGSGHQSLLLRKGGVAEGPEGFRGFGFEHGEIFLFPTWYHGQVEKVRYEQAVLPEQVPDRVTVNYAATIEWSGLITNKEAVRHLSELHVLDASGIEERFEYKTGKKLENNPHSPGGIHIAFVRIYRMEPPVGFPMEKRFGGCRSWVELPEIVPEALVSVLSDEEHERRRHRFAKILGVNLTKSGNS